MFSAGRKIKAEKTEMIRPIMHVTNPAIAKPRRKVLLIPKRLKINPKAPVRIAGLDQAMSKVTIPRMKPVT